MRIGWLAGLAVLAVAGVLFFRAIDTGSSASAAPSAQDEEQQDSDTAGLQRGDVITAVDGTAVETPEDFRDGQAQDVAVTLEAQPEAPASAIPLLPELEGIAADELFGHFQVGQFNYTDADGNAVTVATEAGTVAPASTLIPAR
jgi:hypothetical protein